MAEGAPASGVFIFYSRQVEFEIGFDFGFTESPSAKTLDFKHLKGVIDPCPSTSSPRNYVTSVNIEVSVLHSGMVYNNCFPTLATY